MGDQAMTEDHARAAEQLRAFIREHQPGGCRVLSGSCDCLLCAVDGLLLGTVATPAPVPTQWRDIETAPTDGSWVLLYGPNLLHGVQYVTARWQRPDEGGIPWWKVDDGKFGPYDLRGPAPTHWMPIPVIAIKEDEL